LVIYKDQKHCIFEGELVHCQTDFKILHERMVTLAQQSPEIVFEAAGVYSTALEKFLQDHGYVYLPQMGLSDK
jgi:transposase